MRGLSEAYGSWNTIWNRSRIVRSSLRPTSPRSRPSNRTVPDVGSISRSSNRPVVDLPQPDSPTTPSVSCAATSNDTPDTACT